MKQDLVATIYESSFGSSFQQEGVSLRHAVKAAGAIAGERRFHERRQLQQPSQQYRMRLIARREKSLALTTEQATLVELETIRESATHRHWPTDVIGFFMAADVVGVASGQNPQKCKLVFKSLRFQLRRAFLPFLA